MTSLAKLHLHVTNQCTHHCKHCSSNAGRGGQRILTNSDFDYILAWAREAGAQWLELSGGEPLTLGDDLFHLIAAAAERGLYVSLLSNGCLIDSDAAHKLRAAGTERMGISLYGATAATHDDFTQTPGSFSKTIRGMKHLINAGIETVANIVVTPKNLAELHDIPALLDGIDLYTFGAVVPAGRGATLNDYMFSERGYTDAIHTIERHFDDTTHYFMISLYPHDPSALERYCRRPVEEAIVSHDGHLIPCCVLPHDLCYHTGNAKNRDFHAIVPDDPVFTWLAKGHHAMAEALQSSPVSHNLCTTCIDMLRLLTADSRPH
jgi:MoaA/NifB/PqqE/SkfB family radical SAM enzyme